LNNNLSGIALNCPNCGAPIQNLGQKKCSYCGTGVIDLVKRTWILNDIQEF
jgi:ribosomal protein L37E